MAGQKLELTWVGKNKPVKLEPRLLLEVPEKSYCAKTKRLCSQGNIPVCL